MPLMQWLLGTLKVSTVGRNVYGWTGVESACRRGHCELVQYLVSTVGISLDIVNDLVGVCNRTVHTLHDDPCCTALCAIGSVLIVLLLSCTLCAPCGTTGPLQDGFTPWLHACFAGNLDLIKWLAVDMRVDTSAASAVRRMHSAFVCQSFQLTMLRVAWWSAGWRHWV